jgi:MarR family transcriptional regulator for hemolysin
MAQPGPAEMLGEELPTTGFLPHVQDPASVDGQRLILSWYLVSTGREWSRLMDERLRFAGQTPPRWRVLAWAKMMPGINQTDLAERMRTSGPALVGILDGLAKLGLIERRPSPKDRRANEIHLTAKAAPVIERLSHQVAAIRNELLQDISAEDLRTCLSVLDRIRDRMGIATTPLPD